MKAALILLGLLAVSLADPPNNPNNNGRCPSNRAQCGNICCQPNAHCQGGHCVCNPGWIENPNRGNDPQVHCVPDHSQHCPNNREKCGNICCQPNAHCGPYEHCVCNPGWIENPNRGNDPQVHCIPDHSQRSSQQQSSQKPHTSQQSSQKPHTSQQSSQKPHTSQQSSQKPHTSQQSSQKPHTSQQSSQKPHTSQQSSQKPHTSQQSSQKPHTSQQSSQKPHTSQQSSQKPYTSQQSSQKPYTSQQSSQKPHTSQQQQSSQKPHTSYQQRSSQSQHCYGGPCARNENNLIDAAGTEESPESSGVALFANALVALVGVALAL